jgi:hypothetical protein
LKRSGRDALVIRASAPGQARIVIARRLSGRRSARRCVAPTRHNRRARACTRLTVARTLTAALTAGKAHTIVLRGRGLKAGRYVVTATVSGAGGTSAPVTRVLVVR